MCEAIVIAVAAVLFVIVITDLRSRRIPNVLVLPLLLGGLIESCWLGGWNGLWHGIAGMALGFALYFIPFVLGGMGAGDVKLSAAIGAWIWSQQLLVAVVIAGLVGGLLALLYAVRGGYLLDLLWGTGEILLFWRKDRPHQKRRASRRPRRAIPYSPAIVIGTAVSCFHAIH